MTVSKRTTLFASVLGIPNQGRVERAANRRYGEQDNANRISATSYTVREPDGLAMSSRNKYLEGEDRKSALVLYRALSAATAAYDRGERAAGKLRALMRETIAAEPRAQMQYVSCADYHTLEELDQVTGKALLCMAVLIGKIRLIDNFVLE